MGRFTYESTVKVDFEDRALAHLQTVILAKVRRGEAFAFSWKDDMSTGGGRTTVYIHAHSTLVFKFSGTRTPQLSADWLQALTDTANTVSGLYLVPEPAPGSVHHPHREQMTFKEVPTP